MSIYFFRPTGHYMYAEATGQSIGDRAIMLTPEFIPAPITATCWKFYYHMFGSTMGSLSVGVGHTYMFIQPMP